jgi:DNA-nicking Smr family endonuclease
MAPASDNDRERKPANWRGLSKDDAQLWQRAVADVSALRETKQKAAGPQLGPPPSPPSGQENTAPSGQRSSAAFSPRPVPVRPRPLPVELGRGYPAGIDKRTVIRLRRGLIPPETQIDLHRQTQEGAHRLLASFLAMSQAKGQRCVLVITGKGYGSGGAGVLKTMVPRWLSEEPNRERVLAFCHAVTAHGGDGALYVLLRKPRPPLS